MGRMLNPPPMRNTTMSVKKVGNPEPTVKNVESGRVTQVMNLNKTNKKRRKANG